MSLLVKEQGGDLGWVSSCSAATAFVWSTDLRDKLLSLYIDHVDDISGSCRWSWRDTVKLVRKEVSFRLTYAHYIIAGAEISLVVSRICLYLRVPTQINACAKCLASEICQQFAFTGPNFNLSLFECQEFLFFVQKDKSFRSLEVLDLQRRLVPRVEDV